MPEEKLRRERANRSLGGGGGEEPTLPVKKSIITTAIETRQTEIAEVASGPTGDGFLGPQLNGSFGPLGIKPIVNGKSVNPLALAGPLGASSAPVRKSWGSENFIEFGRDTQGSRLSIEDIISPLKDLFEIPITLEPSAKKPKAFSRALSVKKKIVNNVAQRGKMIKTSRLTMGDYETVAKPRNPNSGPSKGVGTTNKKTLVGQDPPVKE
ncbi:unnamed protein product [Cochlearia groenlandica]